MDSTGLRQEKNAAGNTREEEDFPVSNSGSVTQTTPKSQTESNPSPTVEPEPSPKSPKLSSRGRERDRAEGDEAPENARAVAQTGNDVADYDFTEEELEQATDVLKLEATIVISVLGFAAEGVDTLMDAGDFAGALIRRNGSDIAVAGAALLAPAALEAGVKAANAFKKVDNIVEGVEAARNVGKSAYEIALEGGKHSGWLKNMIGRATPELEKSIALMEKNIIEHSNLIKDPARYLREYGKGDWSILDPRQQQALVNSKWPSDIQRAKEQIEILTGLKNQDE